MLLEDRNILKAETYSFTTWNERRLYDFYLFSQSNKKYEKSSLLNYLVIMTEENGLKLFKSCFSYSKEAATTNEEIPIVSKCCS